MVPLRVKKWIKEENVCEKNGKVNLHFMLKTSDDMSKVILSIVW